MAGTGTISGIVTDKTGKARVANAHVQLYQKEGSSSKEYGPHMFTDADGTFQQDVDPGKKYYAEAAAFEKTGKSSAVEVPENGANLEVPLGFEFSIELLAFGERGDEFHPLSRPVAGRPFLARADTNVDSLSYFYCNPQPDGVPKETLEPK